MIVYCDDDECRNNHDGICENRFSTGQEAISLHLNVFGELICTVREWEQENNHD